MDSQAPRPKVLILGSGALKIGEAGEFDYSGSQAIKALKEEGVEVVLVNPNIATIQTSEAPGRQGLLPARDARTSSSKVIEQERPDGILLSLRRPDGPQLRPRAVAERASSSSHGVAVLGTPMEAIEKTEDRELFNRALAEIDVKTPRGVAVRDASRTGCGRPRRSATR